MDHSSSDRRHSVAGDDDVRHLRRRDARLGGMKALRRGRWDDPDVDQMPMVPTRRRLQPVDDERGWRNFRHDTVCRYKNKYDSTLPFIYLFIY